MRQKIKPIDVNELIDADDINKTTIKGEMRKLYPAIHKKLVDGGWSAKDMVLWLGERGVEISVELFRVYLRDLDREHGYERSAKKFCEAAPTHIPEVHGGHPKGALNMLIFFDTEFSELGIDPRLISIGLVSEDGTRTFYAELSDTYQLSDCSNFVREAVLPHLVGGEALMTMDGLTLRLGNWLESFEQPVQLATDSLSWDWPWIQELFSTPGTWPENLDGKPASLYEMVDSPFLERSAEQIFQSHEPRLRRHYALDDAKVNRLVWLAWLEAKELK